MNRILLILLALILFACSSATNSDKKGEEKTHWDYKATNTDTYWASLSKAYRPCQDGKHQSPINVNDPIPGEHQLDLVYGISHESIENNGHTVMIKYDSGSYLEFDNRRYQLLQFHFHTPSEHYLMGSQYPLEAHLVHASSDTVYLVYSILFEEGDENQFINSFLEDVPTEEESIDKTNQIMVSELSNHETQHFMYEGSFTTPPCTEGVKWIIASTPLQVSKEQIAKFLGAEGQNARITHELFDRQVEVF